MKSKEFKHWGLYVIFFVIFVFNFRVLLGGFTPSPLDGMIGLYHPFRDLYSPEYPNGIPFKNFLLTDPFRQLIVWKNLSIDLFKNGSLPLWNPYEMAGKPLLGNFQSGALYPLNFIFILLPFKFAWSLYIIAAQIIGGVGMYFYLAYLKKKEYVRALGALVFIFSGFFIAWYEWGNIGHAFAWFPLALLMCDRIANGKREANKNYILNGVLLGVIFSLSFLAGHPQTTLYFMGFVTLYLFFVNRFYLSKQFLFYFSAITTFVALCSIQIFQGIQFVRLSLRGEDQIFSSIEGWFVPYQNLLQFFAPDFFGNPSTLNYWGVFNYAEFIGYIGIPFLLLSLFSLYAKKDRRLYFALALVVGGVVFATNNFLSVLPYDLSIPIFSNMQPTRIMGFVSFGLLMLGIYGFEILDNKLSLKKYLYVFGVSSLLIVLIWISVIFNLFQIEASNLITTKRNLILPTGLFVLTMLILLIYRIISVKQNHSLLKKGAMIVLAGIVILDLLRFANKFTPFSDQKYFYPSTSSIEFLQRNVGQHRILSIDDRILAPNTTTFYKIQNLAGYDPLYLKNFAELIVASERGNSDVNLPYGFNRIVSPKNLDSKVIDLLGVKYILSLGEINSEKFELVATEGETKVYENKDVQERAFFVSEVKASDDLEEGLDMILDSDLRKTAIVKEDELEVSSSKVFSVGRVDSYTITDSGARIQISNNGEGFLVVTDSYYPLVKAYIDGVQVKVYETNHALRGVIVPQGRHVVEFKTALF